jgi:hypothetical protein
MSEATQSTNTPASTEKGFLNREWKLILFFFAKRAFESKLEDILRAAAGHEGNSLPAGNSQYQLLNTEADSLCTEFADRWGLDVDLLRARIPGLAKLDGLSVPPPTKDYANLAIIFSAWPGMRFDNPHHHRVAWMQDETETRVPEDAIRCPGNCETCGLCYELSRLGRDVVFYKH